MHFLKGHWQLLLLITVIFLLWTTPVVLPLKFMIVYLHELSHGLAALLTGGSIVEISLSPQQGGHAITRGGSRFLILSAGYVGSLVLGAGLLTIALRSEADRFVVGLFGAVTLLVTGLYIRDLFPLAFCTLTGGGLLAMARYLGHGANDLTLRIIGLASLLYVPYDIFDDTIARSGERSDAFLLSEEFGGPVMFWGGLWLVLSLAVVFLCLRYGIGPDSNIPLGRFSRTKEQRSSRSG
ncbi:M50 family metallopeptidase [Roseibium sp.]|uniref:M50 family metallopeptidase n=1 Tax=Roseibium sp. TaxID=1936156 RepID=UPI003D0CA756